MFKYCSIPAISTFSEHPIPQGISHIAMTHLANYYYRILRIYWLPVEVGIISEIRKRNKNPVDNIPGSTGIFIKTSNHYTISVLFYRLLYRIVSILGTMMAREQ